MMPDLGKYAFAVMASYGASLALLVVLVGLTLWHGARVRRRLDAVEARTKERQNG
jgi:heme exporter protein D